VESRSPCSRLHDRSYTVSTSSRERVLIRHIQDWGANLGRCSSWLARAQAQRRGEGRLDPQRKAVILVALLCPLSYISC